MRNFIAKLVRIPGICKEYTGNRVNKTYRSSTILLPFSLARLNFFVGEESKGLYE